MNKRDPKNHHLIVVSIDAMVYEDLEYASTLPSFARLIENGALIERVRTIYPSETHPVHATMITGAPAGITGVNGNTLPGPGRFNNPWMNFLSEIRCETIFHAAKRAGLTSSVCSWPLTNNGEEYIDYLVPCMMNDYFADYPDVDPAELYKQYGAREELADIIREAVRLHTHHNRHPEVDEFQIYAAVEIIKRFKPNMLFTHPSHVDHMRHKTGIFSDGVREAVRLTDGWIGRLLDAVREAGIEDSTDIVLLSDHGQLNYVRQARPNVLLKRAGLISADTEGRLTDWSAYSVSRGFSAHIYLSRPEDEALREQVYSLLCGWAEEGVYGFRQVLRTEEAMERYGLSGDFSFVIETDGYTTFRDEWEGSLTVDTPNEDYRYQRGSHGHIPEKGPQPFFLGCGPSFAKGTVIAEGSILNHAPTFARIFDLELKDATGRAVEEMLTPED